jgi:hypothetical protein
MGSPASNEQALRLTEGEGAAARGGRLRALRGNICATRWAQLAAAKLRAMGIGLLRFHAQR